MLPCHCALVQHKWVYSCRILDLLKHMANDEDITSSEVEAARADPAPGSVILLKNSHFCVEEEGTGQDAVGNKIRADPEKVKEFRESSCQDD